MDQHGSQRRPVFLLDPTIEGQDGSGIFRYTMVRPGGEMVLGDREGRLWATWKLWRCGRHQLLGHGRQEVTSPPLAACE